MSYSERKSLDDLAHELFKYLFIKISCTPEEVILNDMRLFLHQSNQCTVTPTKIHYLELCDENPDSEETMLHVTENLLKIVKKGQQEWLLLVGDGKTYQHRTQLKRKYDKSLERLLIFLGDWHILKTYQSTLMKAYYGSGLESIAQYAFCFS